MTRIAQCLAPLAVCLAAFTGCSSGKGTEAAAEQGIQYSCAVGNGYTLPANATFPIGSQRIYCSHNPTDYSPGAYPPNVTPCTPAGHEMPGPNQIDVWSRDVPGNYFCARVTLPVQSQFTLDYKGVYERGWVANDIYPTSNRKIDSVYVGPGVAYILTSAGDGACPASPLTACVSGLNWADSHIVRVIQIYGTAYQPPQSVTFYPVGCSPPTCD